VQGEQGTVAIANGDAARGNGALEANVPNRTSGFAFVTVRNESAIATEDVWALRAFVFVPSMQVPTGGSILIARYSGDYSSIALGLTTTGRLELERNLGGQGATTPSTSFFPLDRWVCLELEHARANGLAQVRAFVDEVEDRSLVQTNLPVANRLDQILLGLHLPPSAAAPPARVRIDEVLLTATRQGCGR